MVGKIRDTLNESPPWVSYAVVGVVLVLAVGLVVWQLGSGGAQTATGDKHFFCEDCQHGFSVDADEARQLLRQAIKENPEARGATVKCPKCGKYTCQIGHKCPKCNTYFAMPAPSELEAGDWRDECPECGYSQERDEVVKTALELKKQGKYDPDKQPDYIRDAVEQAEEAGEQ